MKTQDWPKLCDSNIPQNYLQHNGILKNQIKLEFIVVVQPKS